jgi:hypothetical protein
VKVALPISASVSFRRADSEAEGDEEWRSLATETGLRCKEVLQLAAVAVTASSALVVDDSPTEVMTRPWWVPQIARPGLRQPPAPIVPQLRSHPTVERTNVRPAARTDSRTIVAPLSLLLVALSVLPPVGSAHASPVHARTTSLALHEADTTPPVVRPAAPGVSPIDAVVVPVAPVVARAVSVVAPIKVAGQRGLAAQAPHYAAPRSSSELIVREMPF